MSKHDKLAAIKRNYLKNLAIQKVVPGDDRFEIDVNKAINLDPIITTRLVTAWLEKHCTKYTQFNWGWYYLMANKLGVSLLDDTMVLSQGIIVDGKTTKVFSWTNLGAASQRTIKAFENEELSELTRPELEKLFYTCIYHLPIDFSDKDAWQPLLDTVEATVERVFKRFHPDIPAVENNGSEDATAVFTRHIYGPPEEDMGTPYSIWDDIKSMFSWSKK